MVVVKEEEMAAVMVAVMVAARFSGDRKLRHVFVQGHEHGQRLPYAASAAADAHLEVPGLLQGLLRVVPDGRCTGREAGDLEGFPPVTHCKRQGDRRIRA